MTVPQGYEHGSDQIVADDLAGDIGEHERTEGETLIRKPAAFRKQVEAIHF